MAELRAILLAAEQMLAGEQVNPTCWINRPYKKFGLTRKCVSPTYKILCVTCDKARLIVGSMFIKVAIRRFFELLILCVALSASLTFLNMAGVLATERSLRISLIIGVVVFMVLNTMMLKLCYFAMRNNLNYFAVNTFVYLLFTALSLAIHFLCSNNCYTWLFAITKFVKYSNFHFDTIQSALIFHSIGLLTIILSPIGMSWVFKEPVIQNTDQAEDEQDDLEQDLIFMSDDPEENDGYTYEYYESSAQEYVLDFEE